MGSPGPAACSATSPLQLAYFPVGAAARLGALRPASGRCPPEPGVRRDCPDRHARFAVARRHWLACSRLPRLHGARGCGRRLYLRPLPLRQRWQRRTACRMPGHAQFMQMRAQLQSAVRSGAITPLDEDGRSFTYTADGKRWRYDVAAKQAIEASAPAGAPTAAAAVLAERGRQVEVAYSPDSTARVLPRPQPVGERRERQRRTRRHHRRQREGAHQVRHRELGVRRGARPDHRHVVVARRQASSPTTASTRARCPTTSCSSDQTKIQSEIDIEAYPKAGAPNPVVDLFVYDVATKKS